MDATLRMLDITFDLETTDSDMLKSIREARDSVHHKRNVCLRVATVGEGVAIGMKLVGKAEVGLSVVVCPALSLVCAIGLGAAGYNHCRYSKAETESEKLQNGE
ncbi:hypothetical protein BU24DRAFT_57348 [Aaosphaeria arxii CBS 175.79]|uniref:Uncharacterized protein n=1 Tax=Aaosphaeria arxii CBS 175.79 TaxID=1450172 RepID=A0A6A5XBP6_9PLEO|nr:uncharacterized protein BU24DRAFT_57348 [Aaosphaeria arxii CBS 175.79]KAF2010378.1 hypothetical protein BU24DRAFT_57348 [Aaosphaeria arxii CBS 175.79]